VDPCGLPNIRGSHSPADVHPSLLSGPSNKDDDDDDDDDDDP
jgi:hypothetical protein